MKLRLPERGVRPEDFKGHWGVCQNLDCLAPLEMPFILASVSSPAGELETVLCCNCCPEEGQEPVEVSLVEQPPVLDLP